MNSLKTRQNRLSVDIFCRVIDNFGDAGICLRLAKHLRAKSVEIRVFTDDVGLFNRMMPDVEQAQIHVLEWTAQVDSIPADVVVCGFACTLEAPYLKAMQAKIAMGQVIRYVNLEYFSAEPWVEETHGLVSVHPRLGLAQHYIHPGLTQRTGGLLKRQINKINTQTTRSLLVFAYANTPHQRAVLQALANALTQYWNKDTHPALHCYLAHGQAADFLAHRLPSGCFTSLPFMTQAEFDALLGRMDLVWARGEDSATQAMQMGVSMLWQLYEQAEQAHLDKLNAYLALRNSIVGSDAIHDAAHHAINDANREDVDQTTLVLLDWLRYPPKLAWAEYLSALPDLATSVLRPCH